jgi:hypothetical protein
LFLFLLSNVCGILKVTLFFFVLLDTILCKNLIKVFMTTSSQRMRAGWLRKMTKAKMKRSVKRTNVSLLRKLLLSIDILIQLLPLNENPLKARLPGLMDQTKTRIKTQAKT